MRDARASLAKAERDFEDCERARLVAHAMGQIVPADRPAAYQLIELCAKDVTPMAGSNAEMYAALGSQGLDRPGMLEMVSAQAHKIAPYAPGDPSTANSPLPGMMIVVGYGPWVAALAQYGRSRKLADADVVLLREHLPDPTLRDIIAKALSHQERMEDSGSSVATWIASLGATPRSAGDRQVRVEVIVRELASMPRPAFLDVITSLRVAQANSVEPEVRYALGNIIAKSLYARVQAPDRGTALFE